MILLDTHVWLWTVTGETRRVGRKTRQLLARASQHDAIRISTMSVFEVAALQTLGRLRLAAPVESWIREALDVVGGRVAMPSPVMATDAGLIPREALGDPIDRLLVATARALEATLVTADRRILQFGKSAAVRAHDART